MKGLKHVVDNRTGIKNRFGFRKLSIGLTTVFLGSIFFLAGAQPAHADVNTATNPQTSSEVVKTNQSASSEQAQGQKQNSSNNLKDNANEDNKATDTKNQTELTVNAQSTANEDKNAEKQLEVSALSAKTKNSNNHLVLAKSEPEENNVTATITATTSNGTPIKSDGSTQLEEQNNPITVNVKVDANKVTAFNNSTFDVDFGDTGDSAADGKSWYINGYQKGNSKIIKDKSGQPIFNLTYNGMGDFTIKSISDIENVANAGFDQPFNLCGTNANAANGKTILPVTVKYDGKVISEKKFAADIVPVDKNIKHNEIAHIFTHGLTTDNSVFTPSDQTDDKGYKYNQSSEKLQYIVEWNWGEINPLENVSFKQIFSDGQILLPDTIKVFRVYGDQLTNPDGSRKLDLSENGIYGNNFANEDTAFETYLRDHMYHVNADGTAVPVSYSDFKENSKSIPIVNMIKFSQKGKFGDGSNDWSTNGGPGGVNNNNTSVHNPHSTFLIQMDTLLPVNMPASWIKPGDGPSSTVTIPNNPNAVVTSDSATGNTSTYTGFNNSGIGFMNEAKFTANLYFADVTDPNAISDLGGEDGVPESVPGSDNGNRNTKTTTPIKFNNVEDYIAVLEKAGYGLVGASTGIHTSGSFTGSTLYSSNKYNDSLYGNYDWEPKNFTLNFVRLNSQNKSVSDSVKYVYENGPKAGQEVETTYAEPSSQTLSFTQKQVVNAQGNVVYPTTWEVSTGSAGAFDKIVIPTDVDGKTKYSIDYDNITLNNKKLISNSNVSIDKNTHTITITIDKDTIADGTHFDLVVPYKLVENITVHYIDENDDSEINHQLNNRVENDQLHISYSGDPSSSTTNLTNDTVKYLKKLGYKLDTEATNGGKPHIPMANYNPSKLNFVDPINGNSYNANKLNFDNDEEPNDQVYYVYFYHDVKKDKTEQKQIDEVIHYVDEDSLRDLTDPYTSKTVIFTRYEETDRVTQKTYWSDWSTGVFDAQKNAVIPGYTIDLSSKVLSQKLNGTEEQLAKITTDQVGAINTFANKNAQTAINNLPDKVSHIVIVIPYKKNSSNPGNPGNPGEPNTPNKPQTPPVTPPKTPVVPTTPIPNIPDKPGNEVPVKPGKPIIPKPSNSDDVKTVNVHGEKVNGGDKRKNQGGNSSVKPLGTSDTSNNTVKPLGTTSANVDNPVRPLATTASKSNSRTDYKLTNTAKSNGRVKSSTTLPQTGETNNYKLGIIGLGIALVGSLFGLAYRKRKE